MVWEEWEKFEEWKWTSGGGRLEVEVEEWSVFGGASLFRVLTLFSIWEKVEEVRIVEKTGSE